MANQVQIIMGKKYPSEVTSYMLVDKSNIAAIFGRAAVAGTPATLVRAFFNATNGPSDRSMLQNTGPTGFGMVIIASHNYAITSGEMFIGRVNTPGSDCWLNIYDVSASLPDNVQATSEAKNIVASLGVNDTKWMKFNFPTPYFAASGEKFALTIDSNSATKAGNYINVRAENALVNGHPVSYGLTKNQQDVWATTRVFDFGYRINGLASNPVALATGLQDFTTYTLSVPATFITVANATTVNVASMNETSNQFMYKDYGAGGFIGDFTVRWKSAFNFGSGTVSNIVTGLTSTATAFYTVQDYIDEDKGVFVQYRFQNPNYQYQLYDAQTDINAIVAKGTTPPGVQWFELNRTGTRLTLSWYTDEYVTLQATDSIRVNTNTFRYVSHAGSRKQSGSDKLSYNIMNFHIKER